MKTNLNFHNKLKIHQHLILIITSVTLAVVLLLYVFIRRYTSTILMQQNLQSYLSYAHQYFEINISDMVENIYMEVAPLHLSTGSELRIRNAQSKDETYTVLNEHVNKILKNSNLISCIRLIDLQGNEYTFFKDERTVLPKTETSFIHTLGAYDIAASPETVIDNEDNVYVIFGSKWVNYNNSSNLGKILIFINHDKILDTYRDSILNDGSVYISLNGTVLSSSNLSAVGKYIFFPDELTTKEESEFGGEETEQYIINTYGLQTSPPLHLTMTTFVSKSYLYQTMENYNTISLVLLLAVILVSIFTSYIVSARLSRSIRTFTENINYSGNSAQKIIDNSDNEIAVLEKRFYRFVAEIDNLIAQNREAIKQKQEAEFTALQAQINPHFLYNTLESISGMAKMRQQPEIQKICVALGRFFRLSLQKGENIVSVENEIKHIKSYVIIEQIRFPGKFDVVFDIDDSLYEYRMPKIILQPIIENAIHHAFNKIKYTGEIQVIGRSEGEYILFRIADNGTGLHGINPLAEKDDSPTISGYGLNNVNKRIQLEYGSECGLNFEETPGGGTTVIVKLRKTL